MYFFVFFSNQKVQMKWADLQHKTKLVWSFLLGKMIFRNCRIKSEDRKPHDRSNEELCSDFKHKTEALTLLLEKLNSAFTSGTDIQNKNRRPYIKKESNCNARNCQLDRCSAQVALPE